MASPVALAYRGPPGGALRASVVLRRSQRPPRPGVRAQQLPEFLPPEVKDIEDAAARALLSRMRRLPVHTPLSPQPVESSCIVPGVAGQARVPLLLLHGFDRWASPLAPGPPGGAWAWALLGGHGPGPSWGGHGPAREPCGLPRSGSLPELPRSRHFRTDVSLAAVMSALWQRCSQCPSGMSFVAVTLAMCSLAPPPAAAPAWSGVVASPSWKRRGWSPGQWTSWDGDSAGPQVRGGPHGGGGWLP